MNILTSIDTRLQLIWEQANNLDWKDEAVLKDFADRDTISPGYHALRAIAGPLLPTPVWAMDWTAPHGHVYKKGTPAPQWTETELYYAMRPQLRIWARKAIRSRRGGAHNARSDPNAVDDAEMNIAVQMIRIAKQEKDQGRILSGGGFVSYVTRQLSEVAFTGVGGTNAERNALGRVGDLLKTTDPKQAQAIAAMVGPAYRQTPSHKEDDENPFGQFSAEIYQLATALAQALTAGNAQAVDQVKQQLMVLDDGKGQWGGGKIKDAMELIQGVDTGFNIIAQPHGAKKGSAADADLQALYKAKFASTEAPNPLTGASFGSTIPGREGVNVSEADAESIYRALEIGHNQSFYAVPKGTAKKGLRPIGSDDFRYLIRLMAFALPHGKYPGKYDPARIALAQRKGEPVPPGIDGSRDPEIDLKTGAVSKWVQNGQPWLTDRLEIIQDITTGGPIQYGSADTPSVNTITGGIKLTPTEQEVLELWTGLHASSPTPLSQVQIARAREISKKRVSTLLGNIINKTGMSAEELRQKAQALQGAGTAAPTVNLKISPDPFTLLQSWIRQLAKEELGDEDELEESRQIERAILSECIQALNRLDYYINIYPQLTGDRRRIVLREGRAIRI